MSDKNDLAEDRTDWAEDRTILANERTFAGWMRTGMAAVAVAIGLRAVFREFEPTWVAKAVSSVFIAAALYVYWAAQASAADTQKRLSDHHANAQPNGRLKILAIILALASAGVGVILWML
jgi:putative membrane protein